MANDAGNRGADQFYFSALRCQRLCVLVSRLENEENISANHFGRRVSGALTHDRCFKECTQMMLQLIHNGSVHL